MSKQWKIGIFKDSSKPRLGLHGLHTAFLGLPGVEIAALADSNPDPEMRKEIMELTKAKRHYSSLEEMLEREELDIVILCSRHQYEHLEQIRTVAEKGCHIYCEKPISADLEEADEIVRIVERNGIKLCMAHPGRYGSPYRTMKQAMERGEIGDLLSAAGYGKCDHRGGGEDLMTLGTHILDLMIFFFGNPEFVWSYIRSEGKPARKTPLNQTVEQIGPAIGDDIFASFSFPGGVHASFTTKKGLFQYTSGIVNNYNSGIATHMGLSVRGTTGTLTSRFTDFLPDKVTEIAASRYPAEYGLEFQEVPEKASCEIPGAEAPDRSLCGKLDIPNTTFFLEANRCAAWDLICAIQENRLPVSNVYNARTTLEMIYGIYASHLTGNRIDFPLKNRKHPLAV